MSLRTSSAARATTTGLVAAVLSTGLAVLTAPAATAADCFTAGTTTGDYTVPAVGVSEMSVSLTGGRGQTSASRIGPTVGGRGEELQVSLAVAPGQVYRSGFVRGAPGGTSAYAPSGGAGGDGRYLVRVGPGGCQTLLAMAGGGGGGGGVGGTFLLLDSFGGVGGDAQGVYWGQGAPLGAMKNGADGDGGSSMGGKGGRGATGTSGGSGGAGGSGAGVAASGAAGSRLGGGGGAGGGGAGGGGGGGYYFGGGGGAGIMFDTNGGGGGGGGGGAGFVSDEVLVAEQTTFGGTGDNSGLVTFLPVEDTAVTLESSVNPSEPGSEIAFTATVRTVNPAATGVGDRGSVEFRDVTDGKILGTASVLDGVASLNMGLAVGDHLIRATYSGAENSGGTPLFHASTTLLTQAVRMPQTVQFTSEPDQDGQFVHGTYAPTATASSGLPVTFSAEGDFPGVCSSDGSTVSLAGPGRCIVTAKQAGDGEYQAAPSKSQSFIIQLARESQPIHFTSTPPDDLKIGDHYTVTASDGGPGTPRAFSLRPGGDCTLAGAVVTFEKPGRCIVIAEQAAGNGYNAPEPVEQRVEALHQAQTITFISDLPATGEIGETRTVAAKASTNLVVDMFLDEASTGCTIGGLSNTETGDIVTKAEVTFTGRGTCIVDANQAGDDPLWAAAPQKQTSSTVRGEAQEITFTSAAPANVVYGDSPTTVKATGGGSGKPVTFSTKSPSVCNVEGATVSYVGAGTCVVEADQAGDSLHEPAPTASQHIEVAKASLIVVSPSRTIEFGTSAGPLVPTYEGFVNGDGPGSLSTPPTCWATGDGNVGTYGVNCTGATSPDYRIGNRVGTLVITKARVKITGRTTTGWLGLVVGRLTMSATATHQSTGAPVPGLVTTFSTRTLLGRIVTCTGTTNAQGVASCQTSADIFITPAVFSAKTTATGNYLSGSGEGRTSPGK